MVAEKDIVRPTVETF